MGKARIISEQGEGQYTIEIIEARERAESAKNQAQSRINERRADIVGLESDIIAAQRAVDRAASDQADAIVAYRAGNMEIGELSGYTQAVEEAARLRDSLLSQKRSKNMLIAADETLVARVNSLPALRQMQAWCADYTEGLSGEIATAEVPGEIGKVIIKPGFDNSNSWSAADDGAMQPALAGTPAGTFYNLAMLPGWQKWRPTFRVATITAIDGDQCDIDLDSANSSQQGLDVNEKSSYSGVPILYMECNGTVFGAGDRVLVAFADNVETPTVVGFENQPRLCDPKVLFVPVYADVYLKHPLDEKTGGGSYLKSWLSGDWQSIKEIHSDRLSRGKIAVSCVHMPDMPDTPPDETGSGAFLPSDTNIHMSPNATPDKDFYLDVVSTAIADAGAAFDEVIFFLDGSTAGGVRSLPHGVIEGVKAQGVGKARYISCVTEPDWISQLYRWTYPVQECLYTLFPDTEYPFGGDGDGFVPKIPWRGDWTGIRSNKYLGWDLIEQTLPRSR